MSEMPEKKVLKRVLMKLKTKSLTAESQYRTTWKFRLEGVRKVTAEFEKELEKAKMDPELSLVKQSILSLAGTLTDGIHDIASQSFSVCDDLKLYIDSLEIYSAELDKTLTDIFEQAKKVAEEEIKQRQEIMKRSPAETYRV